MPLVEAMQQTIATRLAIRPTDLIVVAVSGGPDSTALLHALHSLGYPLHAAHLNHGFRGAEAESDAIYVAAFCEQLGIPCTAQFRDVPAVRESEKLSAQQAARRARYEFLDACASECGAKWIATGHTRDDRVETLLLNVLRGSGIEGLRGIPYSRDHIVRPLLDVSRIDVEVYCEEHGLAPRRDSSNESPHYARNNVRRELIPYLERRYNSGVREALIRLSDLAAADAEYLQTVASAWLQTREKLCVAEILLEPVALQRRILREWLRLHRPHRLADIGHDMTERIRAVMGLPFALTLPGGDWIVYGDGSELYGKPLLAPDEPVVVDIGLPMGETVQFLEWQVSVHSTPQDVHAGSLRIRTWTHGDRIRLAGGTRKLQDVFTDAKVPREQRVRWPVVVDEAGIVAVPTLCSDIRARGMDLRAFKGA